MRQGKYALFLFDQVFNIDFVVYILDFRLAGVAEPVADRNQFILQDTLDLFLIFQKFFIICYFLFKNFLKPFVGSSYHVFASSSTNFSINYTYNNALIYNNIKNRTKSVRRKYKMAPVVTGCETTSIPFNY